jgi:hypothetical protein
VEYQKEKEEEEEEEEEKIMIDSMRSTPCWIANQGVK